MRRISLKEQKTLLIDMLEYITNVCKKNNIQYSLIGGSLIGAIRHQDIIPWDDDVDIILLPNEYKKLINVLKKEYHDYYKLEESSVNSTYYYPFSKLVDLRTVVEEKGQQKIKDYGVYIDIFKYHYVSNNAKKRKKEYEKILFYKKLLAVCTIDNAGIQQQKNYFKKIALRVGRHLPTGCIRNRYIKICNKNTPTDYIVANWPAYGYDKEVQLTKNMKNTKYVKFNRIYVQISTNYHQILSTTFGDYMKLPPIEERKSNHSMVAYWKDEK